MFIINFYGLDMFLVGEFNEKVHSKIAKLYQIPDEDLIFSASDSYVFYKGHEQTSFNLLIKVDCPVKYKQFEEKVKKYLLEESKNYSVHTRLLFAYYQEGNYYERIDTNYPEYVSTSTEATFDEDSYDQDKEYSEDEIYLGNVFEETGNVDDEEEDKDEGPAQPFNLNDFFKKHN